MTLAVGGWNAGGAWAAGLAGAAVGAAVAGAACPTLCHERHLPRVARRVRADPGWRVGVLQLWRGIWFSPYYGANGMYYRVVPVP